MNVEAEAEAKVKVNVERNLTKAEDRMMRKSFARMWREMWNADTLIDVLFVTACMAAVFYGY